MLGEQGNGRKPGVDTLPMNAQTYLDTRVKEQLEYYEGAAGNAKKAHHRAQTTIIVFGVLVPVIVNNPGALLETGQVTLVVTLMTLVIAILTGLSSFRKWGDLWLSFRMTEELLKHEKFVFITGSGDYQDRDTAFPAFVNKIELIVSAEHNKFRTLIEDARRPTKPPAARATSA